mgnify:CR=1 FL=1
MLLNVLKGKIHRARVVQAELDYVGSITVDTELARAAGILEYEKVQVVDIDNGNRFETYVIAGEPGSGMICVNGAAAHCVNKSACWLRLAATKRSASDACAIPGSSPESHTRAMNRRMAFMTFLPAVMA